MLSPNFSGQLSPEGLFKTTHWSAVVLAAVTIQCKPIIRTKATVMRIRSHLRLFVVAAVLVVARSQAEVPRGWFAPSATKDYEGTVDSKVSRSGKACASIRSISATPKNFGNLMQSFPANDYRSKRVRLTGYVKTLNATGAQFWLRVDSKGIWSTAKTLAFDNMANRPVVGTADWTKCELVLDVPDDAATINLGCMLFGTGNLWIDDLKFEVVGKDVPVTDMYRGSVKLPKAPQNLDFEAWE
jgi:hypothetical protein